MKIPLILIFTIFISLVYSQGFNYKSPVPNKYQNSYDPNVNITSPLTIHLICHSHCDSGWLKTFNDYFHDDVKYILDGIVENLVSDRSKKFIWSEVGFLEKWWQQTTPNKRSQIVNLVENGQLEFVGGGWVMNDEACPDINSIINQIAEGHQFLADTFNSTKLARPVNGWQIDPFGHNTVTPALLSAMGYKHLVLNRIGNEVKASMRSSNADLQFVWRGNPKTGINSDILAHVLDDHYSFPNSFQSYYVDPRSSFDILLREGDYKRKIYGSPIVMIPMGDDFQFKDAIAQFNQIDSAIAFSKILQLKENSKVIIKYSTLRDYFAELQDHVSSTNHQFNQYVGDFYPYGRKGDWWTGYFTTRPGVKGLARSAQTDYRVAQMLSVYNNNNELSELLRDANRNISVVQHHDGITGTSKQEVIEDYTFRLHDAIKKIGIASSGSIRSLAKISDTYKISSIQNQPIDLQFKLTPIVLVNSLGWNKVDVQSIQINYQQVSPTATQCPVKLMLDSERETDYDCVVLSSNSSVIVELSFRTQVEPLGMTTVFINNEPSSKVKIIRPIVETTQLDIQVRPELKLIFDPITRLLSKVEMNGAAGYRAHTVEDCQHTMKYYYDIGGAYSFVPKNTEAALPKPIVHSSIIPGKFKQVYMTTTSTSKSSFQDLTIAYTIKNSGDNIQDGKFTVDYHIHGENNEDIVSRFITDMPSSQYYTDNGMFLMKRESLPFNGEIAEYTFPTIAMTVLNDTKKTFVCYNDRTRGTSSPKKGEFEFYIHRALLQDDNKGLVEINRDVTWLNAKDQCYFTHGDGSSAANLRKNQLIFENRLHAFSINGQIELSNLNQFSISSKMISEQLPKNVHLLSFEKKGKNYLVRLMNIDDTNTVSLDLNIFIADFFNYQVVETDLTGLEYIDNIIPSPPNFPKTSKNIINGQAINNTPTKTNRISYYTVTMDPYEIKTFLLYTS
ncbi:alpha-mannosidase [Heterostelium album PN500]|uniref:alpha-mannosidase n=1 Tax=Heterostelium pallidum (strain ATCC 26659 / Pp 5 / PN500) TaxID=670386 RepID=D3BPQ7_HETP5|nr:alpha-mannosidase [Heterostelium album PN500]EFA76619.1 alpha-mannosidase [Heterostelium album PN500]|eukprot:XP_020428751.1 alpha-mannosidase [Heterostelium album PN500]